MLGAGLALGAVCSCGQVEPPKQTYAEALQIYTAERAELDRMSKLHLETLHTAEAMAKVHTERIALTVELESSNLASADRPWTNQDKANRAEELLREDTETIKDIARLRKDEAQLRTRVLAQQKRLSDAEAAKESLAP